MQVPSKDLSDKLSFADFRQEVIKDYKLACESREASLLGRKEVLTGKAKFGIFGDGKEIAQLALAKAFQPGDHRSGYYRDQTMMLALGEATLEQLFAQLFADADPENDVFSGGRQMNSHFATPAVDASGAWLDQTTRHNSAADTSPTGSQMSRAVGLAFASKAYREKPGKHSANFSKAGDEVVFATIGDASTSEGVFWEAVNAAAVTRIPLAVSVWDDGYGISVPIEYQTVKSSISEALDGFRIDDEHRGMDIYVVKGWDYPALCETYRKGIAKMRKTHVPALFHIVEVTQPQGHSTSGSHERYKSSERLQWESEYDGLARMRRWMMENGIAQADELDAIEADARQRVKEAKDNAWMAYTKPVKAALDKLLSILVGLDAETGNGGPIGQLLNDLNSAIHPIRRDLLTAARKALWHSRGNPGQARIACAEFATELEGEMAKRYGTHLYTETDRSALEVDIVEARYSDESPTKNGYEILNACFDAILSRDDRVYAFGEDLGKIGDVNQGFAGLQEKYGGCRVFDTGIRENTIIGQGQGMAMRGLRPIAEIQYLDYLIYGLQVLADDVATLSYRSRGMQKAPLIVRTRGHRLEGIWHTGSPMGMMLHSLRGMYVLVPRNMTQAAGMYNTLLQADDPAVIVECLNGYRLKERLPDNLAEFTVPLGICEVLREGDDITLVTYGSCVRVAADAAERLAEAGISVELIDAQSLLPFDRNGTIVESLKKTNRVLFLDEDVPGGASAYMLQQVLEVQKGYYHLDSPPATLTAADHRSPYGSDGDYYAKPSAEDVLEKIYGIMQETDPQRYPSLR